MPRCYWRWHVRASREDHGLLLHVQTLISFIFYEPEIRKIQADYYNSLYWLFYGFEVAVENNKDRLAFSGLLSSLCWCVPQIGPFITVNQFELSFVVWAQYARALPYRFSMLALSGELVREHLAKFPR